MADATLMPLILLCASNALLSAALFFAVKR